MSALWPDLASQVLKKGPPRAPQQAAHARALDQALSNADETGTPIGPALDHLRQIITAAEAGLTELRPRLTTAASKEPPMTQHDPQK